MDNKVLESWKKGYITDNKVLNACWVNDDKNRHYPQYQMIEGLIYVEDWNRNLWLCVCDSLHIKVISPWRPHQNPQSHSLYLLLAENVLRYVTTCNIC